MTLPLQMPLPVGQGPLLMGAFVFALVLAGILAYVFFVARVTESGVTGGFNPKLTVHVGGEWDTDVYLGGSSVTESYDRLWDLDEAFGELVREHDLELIDDAG